MKVKLIIEATLEVPEDVSDKDLESLEQDILKDFWVGDDITHRTVTLTKENVDD